MRRYRATAARATTSRRLQLPSQGPHAGAKHLRRESIGDPGATSRPSHRYHSGQVASTHCRTPCGRRRSGRTPDCPAPTPRRQGHDEFTRTESHRLALAEAQGFQRSVLADARDRVPTAAQVQGVRDPTRALEPYRPAPRLAATARTTGEPTPSSGSSASIRSEHTSETANPGRLSQSTGISRIIPAQASRMLCCGPEGIRTPDPLDANEVRYRTAPQALATKETLASRRGWS